ncbi:MAG: glycosyltransferase [Pirellulales bacterium]|nr:glycosyltransferase [Pirellulales bacterium]
MNEPKVSICIPTYNHEAFIAQAVESVLSQRTDFDFEVLIGEDCSTDRTREIVVELARRHPEKIRLRLAETNQGGGRNVVDLLGQCRGPYVTILEGDDYWIASHKLQRQVDALEARPDWAMCFHPAWCEYDDGRPTHLFPEDLAAKDEYTIYDLFVRDFMATASVMFRNRLFEKLPEWFSDVIVGDWVIHLLNADHGNIGYLPEPMSAYRVHEGGIFSKKSTEYKIVTILKMLTKIDHHFRGKYTQEIDENRLQTVRWLIGQWERCKQEAEQSTYQIEQLQAKVAMLEANVARFDVLRAQQDAALVGVQADTAQLQPAVERLEERAAALERMLLQLESSTTGLRAHADEVEEECSRLRTELVPLKQFHEEWHRSPLYKVYRETLRPWRQLRRHWQGLRDKEPKESLPPQEPPSRKVA